MEKDSFQRTCTHPLITWLGFGCVYERFETGSLHYATLAVLEEPTMKTTLALRPTMKTALAMNSEIYLPVCQHSQPRICSYVYKKGNIEAGDMAQ